MDFHFVTLKSMGAATILDINKVSRFICFKERSTAYKYATYLAKHKARFGRWPCVDLSSPFVKVNQDENHELEDSKDYMSLLALSYKNREDLDALTIMTGIQYFYCHEFEYEDLLSIRMTGQDIDGVADEFMYRENMDISLKNI